MNMMISYQELVRTFLNGQAPRQVDLFEFNYFLNNGKTLFEQAEEALLISERYT
ncbi:hypothetical protein G5624_18065 [Klebsiella pneumoniae]|nr:hypothetical protein [Klebsiella pneumoniae]